MSRIVPLTVVKVTDRNRWRFNGHCSFESPGLKKERRRVTDFALTIGAQRFRNERYAGTKSMFTVEACWYHAQMFLSTLRKAIN